MTDTTGLDEAWTDAWTAAACPEESDVTKPLPPGDIDATINAGQGRVDISWAQEPDFGSGIAKYLYRYRLHGTSTWSDVASTTTRSFTISGGRRDDHYDIEVNSLDGAGNISGTAIAEAIADDAEDHEDTESPNDGDEDAVQADLGTPEDEIIEEEGPGPPTVSALGPAVFNPNPVPTCYPDVRDRANPYSTFRTKLNGVGTTSRGDPYRRYHIHYQARLAYRGNVAYTTLTVVRNLPNGKADLVLYDSRNHVPNPKPYYAHFLRLQAQPASIVHYEGHIRYIRPYTVSGGQLVGSRYYGSCRA